MRNHFRVNNNIRLTDMQIFIVYAHVYDLIVPVEIVIRFYPSSAGEKIHLKICLFMGESHLQIRLPAINRLIRSAFPDISNENWHASVNPLLFIFIGFIFAIRATALIAN